ncbi:hypothetical protein DMUE_2389 [Dictyocoela muelleri]|nr:hypothetical protein DMUE_2389 [Dictyocoela muelleri]
MAKLIQITTINELKKICSESTIPVLIKFSAEFCPPCHMLHADLEKCDRDILVCEVDVKCTELRNLFKFKNIPYVVRLDKNASAICETTGYCDLNTFFSNLGL